MFAIMSDGSNSNSHVSRHRDGPLRLLHPGYDPSSDTGGMPSRWCQHHPQKSSTIVRTNTPSVRYNNVKKHNRLLRMSTTKLCPSGPLARIVQHPVSSAAQFRPLRSPVTYMLCFAPTTYKASTCIPRYKRTSKSKCVTNSLLTLTASAKASLPYQMALAAAKFK